MYPTPLSNIPNKRVLLMAVSGGDPHPFATLGGAVSFEEAREYQIVAGIDVLRVPPPGSDFAAKVDRNICVERLSDGECFLVDVRKSTQWHRISPDALRIEYTDRRVFTPSGVFAQYVIES